MLHMYADRIGRSVADIPDVEVNITTISADFVLGPDPDFFKNAELAIYDIVCGDGECGEKGIIDSTNDADEAQDIVLRHMKWHEEGMPE